VSCRGKDVGAAWVQAYSRTAAARQRPRRESRAGRVSAARGLRLVEQLLPPIGDRVGFAAFERFGERAEGYERPGCVELSKRRTVQECGDGPGGIAEIRSEAVGHLKARDSEVYGERTIAGPHMDVHLPVSGADDCVRRHPAWRLHVLRGQRHTGRIERLLQSCAKVTGGGDLGVSRIVRPVRLWHRPIIAWAGPRFAARHPQLAAIRAPGPSLLALLLYSLGSAL
jgi:hypothetical protein